MMNLKKQENNVPREKSAENLINYLKERNRVLENEIIDNRKIIIKDKESKDHTKEDISHLNNNLLQKNTEIQNLNFQNKKLEDEIIFLRQNENHLKTELALKQKPIIERITEPIEKIVYKENPYFTEKNNQIYEELQISIKEEKRAKMKIREKEEEIENLKKALAVSNLKNNEIQFKLDRFKKENDVKEEVELDNQRELISKKNRYKERVFNYDEKLQKMERNFNRFLVFQILKKNRECSKILKEKKANENVVMVNQKFEIVDGTYEIFYDFKKKFVEWIFEIFKKNATDSLKKRNNSYMEFKNILMNLKTKNNYFDLISCFFFRMKNLVFEDLPKLKIVPNYKKNLGNNKTEIVNEKLLISEDLNQFLENDNYQNKNNSRTKKSTPSKKSKNRPFIEKQENLKFPKELDLKITKNMSPRDWVKNMIMKVIKQYKENQKKHWEKYILYLFRLLAIKYRVEYPIGNNEKYEIDEDLIDILHIKICSAAFNFFMIKKNSRY